MPRILGLGDRNNQSKTFGCFDRYYWHYRLHDFPNSRFQEICLLLTLLYKNNFNNNKFYNNRKVKEWILKSIEFWQKIQHRNGSLDEVYPNEYSFCASSFSTLAVSESCLILDEKDKYMHSLIRAGRWLAKHNNLEVANQMAAALVTLQNIYILTKDEYFKHQAEVKLFCLLQMQDKSGFFKEYNGGDFGYQTITLSFLVNFYKKTGNIKVKESIKKGVDWLKIHLNNDGTFDSEKMSRKTQFIYPYSFTGWAKDLLEITRKALEKNSILNPSWLDDRYVIPLSIDYILTYLVQKQ